MSFIENIFHILNSGFSSILFFLKSHIILSLITLKVLVISSGLKYWRYIKAKRKAEKAEKAEKETLLNV